MGNFNFLDDKQAEQAVTETFSSIAAWQQKLSQPYRPPNGSNLATDDEDWPPFPTSQVVWSGLAAASDHLNAIRRHVEVRTLFPMAHLTLCRSALVGAAQAVWVLAPDEHGIRIERARTVLAEMYKRHLQWLQGAQDHADTPHIGTDKVAFHIVKRRDELRVKRDADGQAATLEATKMIKEAAEAGFGKVEYADEAVLAWRSTSGTAHGFPWPLFGTPGTVQTKLAGDDGIAEFQTGGSIARMANAYMAAYLLGEKGWQLLAQRAAIAL